MPVIVIVNAPLKLFSLDKTKNQSLIYEHVAQNFFNLKLVNKMCITFL